MNNQLHPTMQAAFNPFIKQSIQLEKVEDDDFFYRKGKEIERKLQLIDDKINLTAQVEFLNGVIDEILNISNRELYLLVDRLCDKKLFEVEE